ncbi:unnamed protein product [Calicophoron daubneyi]|uniref:EF-hand domain-containing protein n=1 Tax=Calicophoron daubneyi TaxID=300641 RepID=A0AAV2TKY0_CALDB
MDAFADAFIRIDDRGMGVVTFDELERYVEKNKLDKVMITKWKELFDPTNTGKITLETFCDKLGLKPAAIMEKRKQIFGLGPDIRVITSDMTMEDQVEISDEARKIAKSTDPFDPNAVIAELKKFLDLKFGPSWQVEIARGCYWIVHDHIPHYCFHFFMNGYVYLLWKIAEPLQ